MVDPLKWSNCLSCDHRSLSRGHHKSVNVMCQRDLLKSKTRKDTEQHCETYGAKLGPKDLSIKKKEICDWKTKMLTFAK